MNRRLPLLLSLCALFAVGCDKATDAIQISDQERTEGGSGAQAAMQATNDQTVAAASFGLAGQTLGDALANSDLASVDISGLPALTLGAMRAHAAPQALRTPAQGSTAAVLGTGDSASGCVTADLTSGTPVAHYDANGTNGCTASDHVQVSFANGDEASFVFSADSVALSVSSGAYAGTSVTFTFSAQAGSDYTMSIEGTLAYNAGSVQVNTVFHQQFQAHGDASNGSFSLSGDVTDLVHLRKVSDSFQASAAHSSTETHLSWTGHVTIASVDASGNAAASGVVSWDGLGVTYDSSQSGGTTTINASASGQVKIDGVVIGNLVAAGTTVNIVWLDGRATPFDFAQFLSGF